MNPVARLRRRFDPGLGATVVTLHAGDYYVASGGELIGTVLGSCVSACIRDTRLRLGGMNHFMLPMDASDHAAWRTSPASASARYGNVAMERLVNEILKHGGRRADLEVKLVGGGKVLDALSDVGARNIHFVQQYVRVEGFRVVGEDLGDLYARKVLYDPATGSAQVKRLARRLGQLAALEVRHQRAIDAAPVMGDIELFE